MSRAQGKQRSTPKPTVDARMDALAALPTDNRIHLATLFRPYLRDRSYRLRTAALQMVLQHEIRELEDEVRSLLLDKDGFVRDLAVECLGNFHEHEEIKATWLYPCLNDPYWLVRVETLESLAQIGDRSALPLISERLHDDENLVRSYAATAIADLGGKRYLTRLRLAFKNEHNDRAKVGLASALFSLGDPSQFSSLIALLSCSDYRVRCAVANHLVDLALNPQQHQLTLAAVSHAAKNFLYRADQSTMETVEKQLRENS
jgi:hypothetical protein